MLMYAQVVKNWGRGCRNALENSALLFVTYATYNKKVSLIKKNHRSTGVLTAGLDLSKKLDVCHNDT